MILLYRRRETLVDAQLERSRRDEVTYPEVGGTRWSVLPPRYRHNQARLRLGHDEIAWGLAKEAIRLWKAHDHAGITVTPPGAELREGSTVLASRGFGPVTILAPCRIVYVIDEPSRFGFAYGTLPGHPERGEESFQVLLDDNGTVWAEITTFSRPDDLASKLAGPMGRRIQAAVTRRYFEGILTHVARTK